MSNPIQLIVGLGNPGSEYAKTRHNAGFWFIETLAEKMNIILKYEPKFYGQYAKVTIHEHQCYLLMPSNFMNHSGQAVNAVAKFFKVPANAILVAHDELDLPYGTTRLKVGGGHGGHNGLRDIINHLGTSEFARLRIGIGRPNRGGDVTDYVLKNPGKHEKTLIEKNIEDAIQVLPDVVAGKWQHAMQYLHSIEKT